MIRAAVFSDTHGNNFPMLEAARKAQADVFIHLGDHDRDAQLLRQAFPAAPVYSVCGNCDYSPLSPARLTVELGPVRAFLTHGHLYNVSPWHMDSLVYAAEEAQKSPFSDTLTARHTRSWGASRSSTPAPPDAAGI